MPWKTVLPQVERLLALLRPADEARPVRDVLDEKVREATGLRLQEDVVDVLGETMVLASSGVEKAAERGVSPAVVFGIELADPAAARASVARLLAHAGIAGAVEETSYGGRTLRVLGEDEVVWAFGDRLLLAGAGSGSGALLSRMLAREAGDAAHPRREDTKAVASRLRLLPEAGSSLGGFEIVSFVRLMLSETEVPPQVDRSLALLRGLLADFELTHAVGVSRGADGVYDSRLLW